MYTISCKAHFDSAHFLSGYNGRCKNVHGHRWSVSAMVKSESLVSEGESRGMVIDFNVVKSALKELVDNLDHKLIAETDSLRHTTMMMLEEEEFDVIELNFRPTAENFAKYFYDALRERDIPVSTIRVYEGPGTYAEYCED